MPETKKNTTMFAPLVRGWNDIFQIKLTPKEEDRLENENLRIISVAVLSLGILETVLLVVALLIYRNTLSEHLVNLISMASFAVICILSNLLAQKWIRQEADRKKICLLTAFLYWSFSVWGMLASVRHYMDGSQMMIFNMVQISFALFLFVHPVRAAVRVMVSYSVQLMILWRVDHAKGIQIINYYVLAALILSGYIIRYLQKIRAIQQRSTIIEKNEDLAFDSTHDELTGMKNRLGLRRDFPGYIGKDIYIVMIDVDRFKQYNDRYGHEVGDRVLTGIGKLTQEMFGQESVYRYGGDEFLIIIERGQFESVHDLLLVWEREVLSLKIEGLENEPNLHCSYGFVHKKTASEEEVRNLLLVADSRMYEMKQSRAAR